MDALTSLTNRRPLGYRASALQLAALAEQAVAAGAKVTRYTPPELRAISDEADAQRVADARARAKRRVTLSTRVALSAKSRRPHSTTP